MKMTGTLLALCFLGTAPLALADDGPSEVCKKLVEAAKKDDFDAVTKLSLGEPHGPKAKGKFHDMHDKYLGKLKDTNCGSDLTADDHAVVQADSEGKKRLIPFVKSADGWKFDAHTYMAFYMGDMHHGMHHGKGEAPAKKEAGKKEEKK